MDMFERTRRLIGAEALEKLKNARVIVFGLGGVGGSAAEALLRAGVGHLTFVDAARSRVRQIIATRETVGMPKAEAMRARGAVHPPGRGCAGSTGVLRRAERRPLRLERL